MRMKSGILSIKFKTKSLFIIKIQRLNKKILNLKTFFGKIITLNTTLKINSKKINNLHININKHKILKKKSSYHKFNFLFCKNNSKALVNFLDNNKKIISKVIKFMN